MRLPYNRAMPHLDLLLPFALPPAALAADLRKQIKAPALATLVTRHAGVSQIALPEFARALPHEDWLARRLGLDDKPDTSPPVAAALMAAHALPPEPGLWFVLHPVHIHIARDHLVLTDPAQLDIEDAESRALFEIARPLFDEYGHALRYGDPRTWFMRADDWHALKTATPAAASGHNIDLWMPRGEGERAWRKLQNEVQMHWYGHGLNEQREARGQRTVNSLWLWGAAESGAGNEAAVDAAWNLSDWSAALAPRANRQSDNAEALLAQAAERTLLHLGQLQTPALSGDWGNWITELERLEQHWFAPLLEALRAGRLDTLALIATDDTRVLHLNITRSALRKFWRKPTLNTLLP